MDSNTDWDNTSRKELKETSKKLLLKYRVEMLTIFKNQKKWKMYFEEVS